LSGIDRSWRARRTDERDIHKHVWQLPIDRFEPGNPAHARLVELGRAAEKISEAFEVDAGLHFAATRRPIRESLDETEVGVEIDHIVEEMLS
jgi:hypothetical protein